MANERGFRTFFEKLVRSSDDCQWFVAAELAERLCDLAPDASFAWYLRGDALSRLGRLREADNALRQALRLSAPNKRRLPLTYLAKHFERIMRPDLARKWYARAIAEFPLEAATYIHAGDFEAGLGRLAEADALLRKGTKCRNGAIEEAWYNLAVVTAKRGNPTSARAMLKRALKIDPKYALAKKLLRELKTLAKT